MIDLDAIEKRCKETDKLRKQYPWTWAERVVRLTTEAIKDRKELVTEVKRLREALKQNE